MRALDVERLESGSCWASLLSLTRTRGRRCRSWRIFHLPRKKSVWQDSVKPSPEPRQVAKRDPKCDAKPVTKRAFARAQVFLGGARRSTYRKFAYRFYHQGWKCQHKFKFFTGIQSTLLSWRLSLCVRNIGKNRLLQRALWIFRLRSFFFYWFILKDSTRGAAFLRKFFLLKLQSLCGILDTLSVLKVAFSFYCLVGATKCFVDMLSVPTFFGLGNVTFGCVVTTKHLVTAGNLLATTKHLVTTTETGWVYNI